MNYLISGALAVLATLLVLVSPPFQNWYHSNIIESAADSVVMVLTDHPVTATHPKGRKGHGTGFYIEKDTIMTNAHVVAGSPLFPPKVSIKYRDGTIVPAEIVFSSPVIDLAIVRPITENAKNVEPLDFCPISKLKLGTRITTIGHPLGLEWTASDGIVSRNDFRGAWTRNLAPMIITDNKIYQGNSGGPMIAGSGCVAGVSVMLYNRDGQIYSLSISGDFISRFYKRIIGGTFDVAYIGFSMDNEQKVAEMIPNSEAIEMEMIVGDTILSINGHKITNFDGFARGVLSIDKGASYTITVDRNGVIFELYGFSKNRRT